MKTAEDVFYEHFEKIESKPLLHDEYQNGIFEAMKEYARIVATQVRQECADTVWHHASFSTDTERQDAILSIDIEQCIK